MYRVLESLALFKNLSLIYNNKILEKSVVTKPNSEPGVMKYVLGRLRLEGGESEANLS